MNDRKLTKEEKLELIQKIANDGGLYELNKFLNEITFKITEEPPIEEKPSVKEKIDNQVESKEVSIEKVETKEQMLERAITEKIPDAVEKVELKNEIKEDNDPNTASIYRQDALQAVKKDLEDQKERVSSTERTTEIVKEPTPVVEDKPKTLTLEKNNPWGSADGIKHATPGQNI